MLLGDCRGRLVHTLAKSQSLSTSTPLAESEPVVDAVSGIYRLGFDFVTRRVVIDSTVIKLQVVSRLPEKLMLCCLIISS